MGQVEESTLWTNRSINYSTKVSYINFFGIAVALIGNFERHQVDPLQWESLVNLATKLSKEYHIPPERIVAHREIWETACPGKYFDIARLRSEVAKNISQGNQ
jgi:N-acetyl-anhydromuramyl-L-alanine amidase AmpD